jgi:hypothetical protein
VEYLEGGYPLIGYSFETIKLIVDFEQNGDKWREGGEISRLSEESPEFLPLHDDFEEGVIVEDVFGVGVNVSGHCPLLGLVLLDLLLLRRLAFLTLFLLLLPGRLRLHQQGDEGQHFRVNGLQ